jgi:hypothetical protein|tara:strand:- start:450 stop:686 length:237 start_codon:yes stop_codon:yes gene_type:complete
MQMKKPNSSPFFVLIGQQRPNSNHVVFGGNSKRQRCERLIGNPFAGIVESTARIEEFPSRAEAWKKHGEALDIAHGRV